MPSRVFDAAGRLWKVRQKPDPTGQPMLVYETNLNRDPNGNITRLTQADGTVTDCTRSAAAPVTPTTGRATAPASTQAGDPQVDDVIFASFLENLQGDPHLSAILQRLPPKLAASYARFFGAGE